MPRPQTDFRVLIKRIREIRKVTQVELANALGITPTSIHRYEAGTSVPALAVVRDLLDYTRKYPELGAEQEALLRAIEERVDLSDDAKAYLSGSAPPRTNQMSPPRSLLDVNVLVSLTQAEHDVLEATLALIRGKDRTAQRLLISLLDPLLPPYEGAPPKKRK